MRQQQLSLAVQSKFFFLLLLTLALMIDTVNRQPSSELLEDKSLPKCQQQDNLQQFLIR
jgi:hypothetical protein